MCKTRVSSGIFCIKIVKLKLKRNVKPGPSPNISLFIKATLIIIINNEHVLLGTGGTGGGEPRARGEIEK